MSNLLLNLDELHAHRDQSEENRLQLFDEILKKCHAKIKKYNAEFKKQECLYNPPIFVVGRPPYNYNDLIRYLILSLRKNGLKAEWNDDHQSIYISWHRSDINMEQYHSHFSNVIYGDRQFVGQTSIPLQVMEVRNQTEKPKKKKKERQTLSRQHVAVVEYNPMAKDYIPINTSS